MMRVLARLTRDGNERRGMSLRDGVMNERQVGEFHELLSKLQVGCF
jgi:hypothetical protein